MEDISQVRKAKIRVGIIGGRMQPKSIYIKEDFSSRRWFSHSSSQNGKEKYGARRGYERVPENHGRSLVPGRQCCFNNFINYTREVRQQWLKLVCCPWDPRKAIVRWQPLRAFPQ